MLRHLASDGALSASSQRLRQRRQDLGETIAMTLVAGNCHGRHSSLRVLSSRGRFLASAPGQVGVRPGTLSVVETDGELLESQEVSVETLQLRRQRQRHVAKVSIVLSLPSRSGG